MKLAYIDSSCVVGIAFDEPSAAGLAARLRGFDRLFSANLLEAEVRSALARERVEGEADGLFSWITWVYPNRPLTREFLRIAPLGYLKGADLWHLACALFLVSATGSLSFLTLDKRQREVASQLGLSD
ncbi:MAG: PIN domain-containing protein [Acidobacteria bacterium]|nr:PIN domain-containing protein [Acidobacteriota bacterium]